MESPLSLSGSEPRAIGRYLLFGEIAAGGMASVHLGRLVGAAGFSRTVAIKRLLPHFGKEPEFIAMFQDEARIAARIRHPNVVSTLDVLAQGDELFLVMDYVEGESLSKLLGAARKRGMPAPREIVIGVIYGALQGLHAAHEARSETGELLHVVHRDVSPQNILVGVDGTPRVLDFGIAKAMGRLTNTQSGLVKGKFAYMAPEQLTGGDITRLTDVYGASVVLWEALTGKRLFSGVEGVVIARVLEGAAPRPSSVDSSIPPALDQLVMRGLAKDPADRFPTALEMARAIGDLGPMASALEIGEWVASVAGETLHERAGLVSAIESSGAASPRSPGSPGPGARATAQATLLSAGLETAVATAHSAVAETAVATAHASSSATPDDEAETRVAGRGGSRPALGGRASLLGAVVIIGLVVLAVVVLRARAGSGGVASVSPSAVAAFPSAAPARPAASAAAATFLKAGPAPGAAASAAPVASSAPDERPHPAIARPRVPAHAAAPDCNPPSYIDKNGYKVFKPGCLK